MQTAMETGVNSQAGASSGGARNCQTAAEVKLLCDAKPRGKGYAETWRNGEGVGSAAVGWNRNEREFSRLGEQPYMYKHTFAALRTIRIGLF